LNRIRIPIAALITIAALCGTACHHTARRAAAQVVDPQFATLTKEQAFAKGDEFFARKRWQRARQFYQYVYESFPNDPLGRRSLLRIADTYYEQRDSVNLVEAQYKYRDFINRYPGSDRADYAMLQIAMVSYQQMERADRDQAKTREAVEKFNEMIRAYPRSPLRAEAEKRLQDALDRLAKHEHIVAHYYIKRHSYPAAVQRLNYLIDTYPKYSDRAGAFYDLATSLDLLGRKGEARLYYERVLTEFPKSDYASRAKKRLDQTKA
jgi:outer membrane protein assembly factor BamD